MDWNAISFHDSSVTAVAWEGDSLEIRFDGVATETASIGVVIRAEGLLGAEIGGTVWTAAERLPSDGEVLSLNLGEGELRLLVEWHDWAKKQSKTCLHVIRAARFSISEINSSGEDATVAEP